MQNDTHRVRGKGDVDSKSTLILQTQFFKSRYTQKHPTVEKKKSSQGMLRVPTLQTPARRCHGTIPPGCHCCSTDQPKPALGNLRLITSTRPAWLEQILVALLKIFKERDISCRQAQDCPLYRQGQAMPATSKPAGNKMRYCPLQCPSSQTPALG